MIDKQKLLEWIKYHQTLAIRWNACDIENEHQRIINEIESGTFDIKEEPTC